MRGGELLLVFLVLLHQAVGISFLDVESASLTVGDVERFRRHLVDEARHQFSKTFSEEISVFRQGLDVRSVGLRLPETPTEVLLEGQLKGQDASSLSGLELVSNTDRPLALLASNKSGLLLVQLGVRPNSNTLVVTPLTTLLPLQNDSLSVTASFLSNGLLFFSVTKKNVGYRRVMVDAVNVETLAPMNINYWVDVRSDEPLMHFFELSGSVYYVLDSRLYVYNMKAMYFDRLDHEMLDSKFGTSITGFRDPAGYYIVVGMRDNVESPVYVFDPKTSTLHLTQRLVTQNVTDVQHFHDFYTDKHYILLLQDRHPAKIYWFGNEQLLEWQDLASFHGSSSASFATLGMENIIAITNQTEILLLVDNLSGHYKINHTLQVNCATSAIPSRLSGVQALDQQKLLNSRIFPNFRSRGTRVEDVVLMNDPSHPDGKYILAYQCITEQGKALKFDILEAKEVFLAESTTAADDILHNIDELEKMLDSDQSTIGEFEKILAKDSIMLSDSDQTWNCSVSIEESLIVEGTLSIDNLKLIATQEQKDKTLESLVELIGTLQSNIDALEKSTDGLLYGSRNQLVTVPITLQSLNITHIDFSDEPSLTKLNGLSIQDLESSFLRKSKNQTIYTPIEIDELAVDNLRLLSSDGRSSEKPGLINGIQTRDLMRRSVENQIITGHHTFTNLITYGNLTNVVSSNSPIFINNVSTSDIVIDGTREANFTGSKTLSNNFQVDSLKVVELMGEYFDNWVNSLVRTNSAVTQTLTGNVIIEGDLYVHDNVDVAGVNNINLRDFEKNILRTTGPAQIVEGPVIFSDYVSILGNINVSSINNIRWNDIVDSTSNQKIESKFIIEEATVSANLQTDDINGIDLSTEAVLQGVNQIIEGRTHFTRDVAVRGSEGVTMDRSSRINGVDPSELRALLSNVGHVIIKEEFNYESHLSFNCNLNIDILNGVVVDHLPTNYWRKNLSQTVPGDIAIPEAVFIAPLKAKSLNQVNVDQYLHLKDDQTITGDYKFRGGLTINADLTMSPNTTVDGVDLRSLRDHVITLDTDQIITGDNEFRGGLSIEQLILKDGGLINSVSLESVALLNKTNYFLGNVTFQGPVNADLFLPAGDISTGTLNKILMEKEASDIVKVNETATIKGNLLFNASVQVNNFTTGRNIDGINLGELEKKALKRASPWPQNITGNLIIYGNAFFNGSLNVQNINGEEFSDFVQSTVTNDFGGIIRGHKKFLNDVNIIADANIHNYNGKDVDLTLSSILTRSTDQNITGDYTFVNAHINELIAPIINNLSLDDVLLTRQAVNNSMDILFSGGVLVLELNSPSDIISGCDIKLLENHMNWRDFNSQDIKEPLIIEHLHVTNDVVSLSGRIVLNAVHGDESRIFEDYIDSFVTKSAEQIVTGEVKFDGNVSIVTSNTPFINFIDADDVVYNSLRRSDQKINCRVNFRNTVMAHNLIVQGDLNHLGGVLIEGVNFRNLSRDSVRKSRLNEQEILGKKISTIGLVIIDNCTVNSLNGFPVANFVKMGPSEIVESEVIFETGIEIEGNLTVGGLLDGISLDTLKNRIPIVDAAIEDTNITFELLDIQGDLVTSNINDVLLSDLVLTGTNATQLLTGEVIFAGGLTVDGDIEVLESLNGMDVADMNRTIAMMNRDELIQERVVFKGDVFAPNARVLGGRLSTLDFDGLHSDMVVLNETIHDDLRALQRLQDALEHTNEENLARVEALRSQFDYLIESDVFEQLKTEKGYGPFLDIAHSYTHGLNSSLALGLMTEPCEGSRAACYCHRATQTLQVTESGQLSPSPPLPGVMELMKVPSNPNVLLELNTTCLNDEPSTSFTTLNVLTAHRSKPQTLPLDYVIKSKFLAPEEQPILAVISEQAGSGSQLSIVEVDSAAGTVGVTFVDYVLVSQELSDLCVLELGGVWSIVVTGRRRPNTDGNEAETYRYEWDHRERKLVLRGIYPGYGVSSCLMFTASLTDSSFLLLSQEDIGRTNRDHLNSSVLVFRQSPAAPDFERFQSLGVQGVVGIANITIGDQLLVAMVTRTGLLYIYELHYAEGFQTIERVRLPQAHPNGIVWVGPATIYSAVSKANLTRFQNSDGGKNRFGSAHKIIHSRSGNGLLYCPNKDASTNDSRIRGFDLGRVGSSIDGDNNDASIEDNVRRLEHDGEKQLSRTRFIVGYDNLSKTRPHYVEHNETQTGLNVRAHEDHDNGNALIFPGNSFDSKAGNKSLIDQAVDFVITKEMFPQKLPVISVSNNGHTASDEKENGNEILTTVKTAFDEISESTVPDNNYNFADLIDLRSVPRSQSDLLGSDLLSSEGLAAGHFVPETDVIIQHPSFLAIGSASGIVLYEIRTLGIDGERLLSEVRLLVE